MGRFFETRCSFHSRVNYSNSTSPASDLTEATVSQFATRHVQAGSVLLSPGQQCRVCLRRYVAGDLVRCLPCRHHFHRACIDQWLLHRHPTCPVDGVVYTNESVRLLHEAQRQRSVCTVIRWKRVFVTYCLVAWHSGTTSVFGRQTFPFLHSTCN